MALSRERLLSGKETGQNFITEAPIVIYPGLEVCGRGGSQKFEGVKNIEKFLTIKIKI